MKKFFSNNYIKTFFIVLINILMVDIIFKLINGSKLIDVSMIRIFLSSAFISSIIALILSNFPRKIRIICTSIVNFIVSAYACAQAGFYNFLGVYMSLQTSSQFGAVVDYIKDFFLSFKIIYFLTFIPFILTILYFIFMDKEDYKFSLKKQIADTIVILLLSGNLFFVTIYYDTFQNKLQTTSNMNLFLTASNPSLTIEQFGTTGFGILDIKAIIHPVTIVEDYVNDKNDDKEITDKTRVIDDTAFNSVIKNEDNSEYKALSNYFINQTITDKNDYTGMFKDKNLIVIMMESANDIFINPEYYPNFYKLYTEGWSWENNYSPRNSCATMNNEFSGMTGLYTIQNNCTANVYKDNTYFTSIFNLFNKAGYKTSSMHDYTEHYYARSIIHKNLGSGIYYGVESLGIPYYSEYRNWASDEDFMEKAMDITLSDNSDEPFMLWLTTVSAHQPYGVSSVEGDKYLDLTENTDYPIDLRRYMSKLKTFDNSLGILLSRLEESGKLDDTVIALYGDHYPYGLKNDTISNVLTYDLEDYEVERTPMVIYNSKINHEVVEKYSSYINLTPTLANMFNLDYDARYYMGADVFSKNYLDLVVFADGSWKNKDAYYNASDATIKYTSDKTYNVDKVLEINNIVTGRMQVSASIIRNNYFNYLETNLKELEAAKQNWEENE